MKSLENQQDNCQHTWDKAKQVAKEEREFEYKSVAHGSDIFPEISGSHTVTKMVWRRECLKCGLVQETDKTKPIVVGNQPVF